MQTNRKYLNRVYTNANKPQWIKPIRFNEVISLKVLLSNVYQKVNEIIEALPNNWPVLIDVDMRYTAKQITVEGSVFLDFNKVLLNETLSIENDGYTGLLYVNMLNDRFRPVLEISPKFMEPNWTTLYVLNVVNGNIQDVVYNDIYAGMHESDPNAHKELFDELREYIDTAIDEYFKGLWNNLTVYDYNENGPFESLKLIDVNNIEQYNFLDVEFFSYSGVNSNGRMYLTKPPSPNGLNFKVNNPYVDENNNLVILNANILISSNQYIVTYDGGISSYSGSDFFSGGVFNNTTIGITSEELPFIVPKKMILRGYTNA